MMAIPLKPHFIRKLIIASAIILQACATPTTIPKEINSDEIRFIASESLKKSGFPLSTAVESDGWIFLSGALGTSPGKGLVKGGIEPETRQTMDNIKATLHAEGLGMDRIEKCTVMLADMAEWPAFNAVYKEYFIENYPARSAFGTSGLAVNARVEIKCIARR